MALQSEHTYDVIVIGSGIGGLASAALLAKINHKKVLILEKHWTMGGLTHEFRRGDYHFDVGLHYVGEMQPGDLPRQVFDFISDGRLGWTKMPEVFERFIYPDFAFEVSDSEAAYKAALARRFPDEEAHIHAYFKAIHRAAAWSQRHYLKPLVPSWLQPFIRLRNLSGEQLALSTTRTVLDRYFTDPKLKALLASQWGDYGLTPAHSAFAIHALIVRHYLNGAWFPTGGGKRMARAILPAIEAWGGRCLVNHEVLRILVRDNQAVGVEVEKIKGTKRQALRFYAPVVISNVGADLTYKKLLPKSVTLPFMQELQRFERACSAATLYIGFRGDPRTLGFKGENHWIFTSYDHDGLLNDTEALLEGRCRVCYLSFPSLKNPTAKGATAEIICFVDYDHFTQWQDKSWKKRGEAYEGLKQTIADGMLQLVESHYPGFCQLIACQELSTPLTMQNFTSREQGMMYGLPAVPARYRLDWLTPETPVANLYLSGSDICSLGIVGALMGGVAAAAVVNGRYGFFKVMHKLRQATPVAPASGFRNK